MAHCRKAGRIYRGIKALVTVLVAFVLLPGVSPASQAEPAVALATFGAIGDGRADDTAAVQAAIRAVSGPCLDGGGRTYRVRGTLRAASDVCLVNMRLVQDLPSFSTAPFISGTCAVVADASALIPCGDPAIGTTMPDGLAPYLATRTLLIRPEQGDPPIKVTLRHVRIDRGNDPASGARSEAAGLWIQWADRVELDDVEVTGAGKGYGVFIAHAQNVRARNLHIHDLVWAPYQGDAPLSLQRIREQGWNTAPIREFREKGRGGADHTGFVGVRVQEQLTCLMIVESSDLTFEGLRVERCLARFAEDDFPWQADGVGIGQSTSRVKIGAGSRISDTWEGIDVVGGGRGVRAIAVDDTTIGNSFGYGVKLGYDLADVTLTNLRITGAGLAGVVFYGAVRNAALRDTRIAAVGSVDLGGKTVSPWSQERAGILIEPRDPSLPNDWPDAIKIARVKITGGPHCRSGLTNITPVREIAERLTINGCENVRLGKPR